MLGYDPDPALAEVFSAVAPIRERLIARGYEETSHAADLWRHARPCATPSASCSGTTPTPGRRSRTPRA